ncbi:hypothetical protein L7F22_048408 [Adiantum nelumboides]|nr:hypothetical protein [Adiantum nelumboides]
MLYKQEKKSKQDGKKDEAPISLDSEDSKELSMQDSDSIEVEKEANIGGEEETRLHEQQERIRGDLIVAGYTLDEALKALNTHAKVQEHEEHEVTAAAISTEVTAKVEHKATTVKEHKATSSNSIAEEHNAATVEAANVDKLEEATPDIDGDNLKLSTFILPGGCTTAVCPINLLILYVNGVVVKRWFQKAPSNISSDLQLFKVDKHMVLLRPGLIEFLVEVGPRYDVGCWSSMTRKNMMPIVNLIENEVVAVDSNFKFKFHFLQEECVPQEGIYYFQWPQELLFLKPFTMLLQRGIQMDPMHTLLIDDNPNKGYLNPLGTTCCVTTYNGNSKDLVLLNTLLPYLHRLYLFNGIVPEFSYKCPYEGLIFEKYTELVKTDPLEVLLNIIEDVFADVEGIKSAVEFIRADPAPTAWPKIVERIQMLPTNVAREISKRTCFHAFKSW